MQALSTHSGERRLTGAGAGRGDVDNDDHSCGFLVSTHIIKSGIHYRLNSGPGSGYKQGNDALYVL